MWMPATPAGDIFIFHQLAQSARATAPCLQASVPRDCRAWPPFHLLRIHFPARADSCSTCLSNFSQQIFLCGIYSIRLWLLSYQGTLWLYLCICPSVVVRSRNAILTKRYDFCVIIWSQWCGMANKNIKSSQPCMSLFFPSTVLMYWHLHQTSTKKPRNLLGGISASSPLGSCLSL